MSSTEASAIKSDSDIERLILRPQRPPPPPPTQSEPSIPMDLKRVSFEFETTSSSTDISNESNKDVKDNQSSFLFEFKDLFDSFDYEIIRNKILSRQMTTCPFTTVLWRIFLHCLPRDSSQWNQIIDASRDHYNELVDKYLLDLRKIRENNGKSKDLNHPLSQEENSLWNQYYVYEELKENIYQDVIRTCQEIAFFRQKYVLDLLLSILYIHSRHYGQSLPYRQGMHEILAVIVYLIHLESITVNEYSESNELMKKLYDPVYLAHDSFAIYEKIMEHLQPFYDFKSNNLGIRKNININVNKHLPFQRSHDVQVQMNDTVMRVNSIFERLKNYDLELYDKLQNLSIEPTVYGIRWLRLLFGREVPFGSIPIQTHGVLEYSCCLQYLMQPNVISNVENVIQNALSLEKYSRTKQFQRSSSNISSESTQNRSVITDVQKSTSPIQSFSLNPLIDSIKSNSTSRLMSLSQMSKPASFNPPKDSEMDICPGKETRQQFDNNVQIQKYCAEFMNKFINRIQSRICDLQVPNEEVLIQLNGLKQIANILEGKLMYDDHSLQALLNYQCKEKSVENDINDTA
ncbi:unnamed protein product [Rotaria sp. Silwood1]|nr:unnamed protein product [Rotaria sp. Silwood1]CAF1032460.1 unnamed protein product [Rotaria sp. Silwood1]